MFPLSSKHVYEDPPPTDTKPAPVFETPFRRKKALEGTYQESKHEDKKKIVCTDIGPYLRTVPYSHFFDHILPDLRPSLDPEAIVEKLKANGSIKAKRFACFPKNPVKVTNVENVVFQPLETLVNSIVAVSRSRHVQPTMKFACNPDGVPESISRINLTRPDGYALLYEATGNPKWVDIGVTGEFKKSAAQKKREDNDEKVAWSMHHCLCEDPRRRFNISFSIENDGMRLWFCNRQEVQVSTPFKFIINHRLTVHFFLSIMYAKPHELGWDPTMTRVGKGQYDITVHIGQGETATYRTLTRLSDVGADVILGRGTRVWEVMRVVQGVLVGPPLTLKDIWIDDDRPREADIYRELRKSAVTEEQKEILNRVLLEVECHGDVFISEEGRYDHTVELPFRGAIVPESAPRRLLRLFSRASPQMAKGFWVGGKSVRNKEAKSHPKLHYRMLLRGVYKSLDNLTNPFEVFLVLSATSIALRAIHEQGWVHRDINPGNILVRYIGREMEVKLIDLEYAKPMGNDTAHPSRSGMRGFTAVEVETSTYRFTTTQGKPVLPSTPEKSMSVLKNLFRGSNTGIALDREPPVQIDPSPSRPVTPLPEAPFRYNPLHDLESLWWTAVYFFVHCDISLDGHPYAATEDQRYEAQRLFGDSGYDRFTTIDTTTEFKKAMNSLHPSMRDVAATLDTLRDMLCKVYRSAEQDTFAIDHTVARGLYHFFATRFHRMADQFKDSGITVHRIRFGAKEGASVGKKEETRKRKQSDLSSEGFSQHDVNAGETSGNVGDGPASRTRLQTKRTKITN
ncbi:hypothetical protein NM688_g1025 [Phlebia brevispora]|uniref:Uncharacterized protein n=1 Tax=Phlebia brevispora TaxID=194682 RepID=A0ACC1TDF2_9APHY|nr:hypothetical protein NM688_g1025 [Phlebia brevispora]